MSSAPASDPLYKQVYDDLERKIATGIIRYMERLPPLPEMCALYGVSSATMRRALNDLERDGLIIKRRGRSQGTFAIKRLVRATVRVLLVARFDMQKSPIESYHEVYDLLAGINEAGSSSGCDVEQVSATGFDNLPAPGPNTGYVIFGMTWADYEMGMQLAEDHNAPFVLINAPRKGFPCVRVDMEHGAFLSTNYLLQLGHRRVAYVGPTRSDWFTPRFQGYQRALRENDVELDVSLVRKTDPIDQAEHWRALDNLLALPDPPTAVVASSDYLAMHLLSHCRRLGISVPRELSLCGYDNISEAASIEPALTTVDHPRREQGQLALELLEALLEGADPLETDHVMQPSIIVRDSCAPPAR